MSCRKLSKTFEDVIEVSSKPDLRASHRVAAWNTLCALIDQCSDSQSGVINLYIWDYGVWDRSFALYLEQSPNARPKSSKQLLGTLGTTLRKAKGTVDVRPHVGKRLVEGILNDDDHGQSKACLQALAHFLARNVLNLDDVLNGLPGNTRATLVTEFYTSAQQLLTILFKWIGRGDFGSIVSQVVSVVLDKIPTDAHSSNGKSLPLWTEPLNDAIGSNVEMNDLRLHLFPVLFRRSLSDYIAFLHARGLERLISPSPDSPTCSEGDGRSDDELLYAALQAGKELGLLYENHDTKVTETSSSILVPLRCIDRLIRQSSRTSRLTGLSLLITSHAATRPFPTKTFKILKRRLALFFADTDANFRSEVFILMQKLMDRLRAITGVLARKADAAPEAASTLGEHRVFLDWLMRFLSWELRPTSSYQRHISALKTLSIIVRSGVDDAVSVEQLSKSALSEARWPFHLCIMTPGLRRQLLDLLIDPFDDVRQTAAVILSIYSTSFGQQEQRNTFGELSQAIDRAERNMLATGRADHADGVAHLYSLLFRYSDDVPAISRQRRSPRLSILVHLLESLEHMLSIAKSSLPTAVNKYPIHGLLTSLRYILTQKCCVDESENLPSRLVECLHRVWETVIPVLCNDAPEGYMPEDAEELPDVSTKDTLSYCWRALKESSLLLGVLVTRQSPAASEVLILSNLCFTQLAELRHRGAFSTVAQTWITCCIKCSDVKDTHGQVILRSWYTRVLDILNSRTTINTRRSAGLPSLVCGLLIADKTGHAVAQAIKDLSAIARQNVLLDDAQKSSLPQVHALNCIKDILKNTRLGEVSESFSSEVLVLAAKSLRSEAWAIRNCGLMLFRAVIDRLLGTSESNVEDDFLSKPRLSVQQYPELLDIVLDLLHSSLRDSEDFAQGGSEHVFPALQLLQQIQIPQQRRFEAKEMVFRLTVNSSWHVRDKAARTNATIVGRDLTDSDFQQLLLLRPSNLNGMHGTLLCAKYLISILQKSKRLAAGGREQTNGSSTSVPKSCQTHICLSAIRSTPLLWLESVAPVLKAIYIDTILEIVRYVQVLGQDFYSCEICRKEAHTALDRLNIERELELTMDETRSVGEAFLRRSLAHALGYNLFIKRNGVNSTTDQTSSLILSLGQRDRDACSSMFKYIGYSGLLESRQSGTARSVLLRASIDILSGNYDLKLKCEVQRCLLYFVDHGLLSGGLDEDHLRVFVTACKSASLSISGDANQQYTDQWLQLQALALDHRSKDNSICRCFDEQIVELTSSCSSAIRVGDYALFSHEAVALAISRTRAIWRYLNVRDSRSFCDLCFVVYDLLNDDDEDIRLLVSQTTSQILATLGAGTTKLESSVASQRLMGIMSKKWSRQSYFAVQAFDRAFHISESERVLSVADRLATLSTVDTALFAEERQNLYIDDAREVKAWSQVIQALYPSSTSRRLLKRLAPWVSEGLEELTKVIEANADGPLGWSTKPDVFKLGLQVLYGAEVLLHAVEKGVKLPIRPSHLREKLAAFKAAGMSQNINPLWMREIDHIIDCSVIRQLGLRWKVLHGVAGSIGQ